MSFTGIHNCKHTEVKRLGYGM